MIPYRRIVAGETTLEGLTLAKDARELELVIAFQASFFVLFTVREKRMKTIRENARTKSWLH